MRDSHACGRGSLVVAGLTGYEKEPREGTERAEMEKPLKGEKVSVSAFLLTALL